MQSSHTFTVDSAVFDERNLVSAAGLVPVLELAEQTGLSELIAEHVQLPSTRVRSGAVNPAGKPRSMPDLSRAIGVSARTLQDGFQRYVGVSPTCYLREVRLQRARADLSNPALCTTVSDTARIAASVYTARRRSETSDRLQQLEEALAQTRDSRQRPLQV